MWDANPPEVQAKFDFTKTPAEGRIGTGDDIAQIAAFLCEEGSRWIVRVLPALPERAHRS